MARVDDEEESYENVLNKLVKEDGVRGWIVVSNEGIPVKYHGYEERQVINFAGLAMSFVDKCSKFLNEDFVDSLIPKGTNEVRTLQLRTSKNEIIIAPHSTVILIVIYEPSYVEPPKEEGEDDDDLFM